MWVRCAIILQIVACRLVCFFNENIVLSVFVVDVCNCTRLCVQVDGIIIKIQVCRLLVPSKCCVLIGNSWMECVFLKRYLPLSDSSLRYRCCSFYTQAAMCASKLLANVPLFSAFTRPSCTEWIMNHIATPPRIPLELQASLNAAQKHFMDIGPFASKKCTFICDLTFFTDLAM